MHTTCMAYMSVAGEKRQISHAGSKVCRRLVSCAYMISPLQVLSSNICIQEAVRKLFGACQNPCEFAYVHTNPHSSQRACSHLNMFKNFLQAPVDECAYVWKYADSQGLWRPSHPVLTVSLLLHVDASTKSL